MNSIFKNNAGFNKVRWIFIALFFIIIASANFFYSYAIPIIAVLSLFIAVSLHGIERYGLKNILVFFGITWLVSNFFEALSIQTGFPFGHYHYEMLLGPRIFQVPIIIMPAYFGMGYASWNLSHILQQQFSKKLAGSKLFFIPFVAAFIMVMWDVCLDPIASTINSLWVWEEPGSYFGVPLENFFGWFLVVYIIFQLFSFYISRNDIVDSTPARVFSSKLFWVESIVVYMIFALSQLMNLITYKDHMDIYGPMAMLTFFTMIFVGFLASLILKNVKEIS